MKLEVTLTLDFSIFDSTTGKLRDPNSMEDRLLLVAALGTNLAKIKAGLQVIDYQLVSINESTITDVKVL